MGDWFRVAAMPGTSDAMLKQANENIGQYYFDRQMWVKASDYFKKVQRVACAVCRVCATCCMSCVCDVLYVVCV